MSTAVGDEGGFAPDLKDNEDALKVIGEAVDRRRLRVRQAGLRRPRPRRQRAVGQREEGLQVLQEQSRTRSSRREADGRLLGASGSRNIRSARSKTALPRTTGHGWKLITDRVGNKVQLVGDDLFVTNVKFLEKGIKTKTANSILVKVNQIGTLSETFAAVNLAIRNGYTRRAEPSQRRNRRHARSPTSPWRPTAARSRPARRPAAIASPSTTSCSASKSNWATAPCTAGSSGTSKHGRKRSPGHGGRCRLPRPGPFQAVRNGVEWTPTRTAAEPFRRARRRSSPTIYRSRFRNDPS